jgi:hypothetical protein
LAGFYLGGHYGEAGDEAHAGVDALCGGEEGGGVGRGAVYLFAEFDEVVCYGDLGADVAELREGSEEEVFPGGVSDLIIGTW